MFYLSYSILFLVEKYLRLNHKMKGGSIASDSVVSLVNQKTFDQLNSMFDNKFQSPQKAGCGCRRKHTGGNAFSSMMGSTTEAFQGNVMKTPSEYFANVGTPALNIVTPPNVAKNVNSGKASKSGNASKVAANVAKAANVTKVPANVAANVAKVPNAGKAVNVAKVANVSKVANVNVATKPVPNVAKVPSGGAKKQVTKQKAGANVSVRTGYMGVTGGAAEPPAIALYPAQPVEGGKPYRPKKKVVKKFVKKVVKKPVEKLAKKKVSQNKKSKHGGSAQGNVGAAPVTMSELLASNSGSFNVKNKNLIRGGAEIPIGPKLDIHSLPLDAKPTPPSTSLDMMANESFNAPQLIQKYMNYGTPADVFPMPFSYGQLNKPQMQAAPDSGSALSRQGGMWKKKVVQRVKQMQKQNKQQQKQTQQKRKSKK